MAHNTIGNIVYETCEAIWQELYEEYIPFPTTALFENIEKEFAEKWKFSNCIGAIDGKLIRNKAPAKSGTQYYNYKKYIFHSFIKSPQHSASQTSTGDNYGYASRICIVIKVIY
uniref:DDE Tnp4 domain-containing protein n=1 Tax=Anopheles stephensi TaxID=30069 RepID=A0A182YP30_ANOST